MSEICQLKGCGNEMFNPVRVNENIGDGSFVAYICPMCAEILGVSEGDDLPDNADISEILRLLKEQKDE